jgi:peptidoglycan/xylan/chitin deacetylase (PgdA/CDA1 family)
MINSLSAMSPDIRRVKLDEIISFFKVSDYIPLAPTLSWDTLRYIQKNGNSSRLVDYGSHSHSHECLSTLGKDLLQQELYQSKHLIEQELDITPVSIAYPCGLYNQSVLSEVSKYFKFGFTTSGKLATVSKLNDRGYCLSIPRISVYTNDPRELFLRINGLEAMIAKFRSFNRFVRFILAGARF